MDWVKMYFVVISRTCLLLKCSIYRCSCIIHRNEFASICVIMFRMGWALDCLHECISAWRAKLSIPIDYLIKMKRTSNLTNLSLAFHPPTSPYISNWTLAELHLTLEQLVTQVGYMCDSWSMWRKGYLSVIGK